MRSISMAIGALLFAAMPASHLCAQNGPLIQNFEMEGNLESPNDIGCIALAQSRPSYNPVDLFRGAAACIAREQWEAAAHLYALGALYGRYDMARVSDRTAHQAVVVAQMEVFGTLDEAQNDRLMEAVSAISSDPESLGRMCEAIRTLGPPSYKPRYMTRHGMGAFMGREGDEPEGFKSQDAFRDAMKSFLKCP